MIRLTSSARRYPASLCPAELRCARYSCGTQLLSFAHRQTADRRSCRYCAADRGYGGARRGAPGAKSLFRSARYPGERRQHRHLAF